MIKFFRKIRQNLLMENKTGKYFKYAIGEILLVVIGILIALQINNWNENSKERNIEQEYLVSLKEEFNHNLIELDSVIKTNTFNRNNAVKLSNVMGPDSSSITEKEFANLTMNATNWEVQYRPNQAVLDEIISSGKLAIFSNNKLKFALSAYYGTLYKVKSQEEEHSDLRFRIIGLTYTKGNVKKLLIGEEWESFGIGKSKFELGNLNLLKSQELDNLLVDFILTSKYLNTHYYSELKQEIDLILKLINQELKK